MQFQRRDFLKAGLLLVCSQPASQAALQSDDVLRVGLITDLHYADKPTAGTRHYRHSLQKFDEAATQFRQDPIDVLIELGDLIDAADTPETERIWLKTINRELRNACSDRHYVLGNHCVDTLTKPEFLGEVEQQNSWYSFDRKGWHFVILDACFRRDGTPYGRHNFEWTDANLPAEQIEWLGQDLMSTQKPVIIFTHQRLDDPGNHGIRNQAQIRSVLEANNRVVAVFQGHSHANDLNVINGIPYCTLVAMVEGAAPENSGFSTLALHPDGTAQLNGFRKQRSHEWLQSKPN